MYTYLTFKCLYKPMSRSILNLYRSGIKHSTYTCCLPLVCYAVSAHSVEGANSLNTITGFNLNWRIKTVTYSIHTIIEYIYKCNKAVKANCFTIIKQLAFIIVKANNIVWGVHAMLVFGFVILYIRVSGWGRREWNTPFWAGPYLGY